MLMVGIVLGWTLTSLAGTFANRAQVKNSIELRVRTDSEDKTFVIPSGQNIFVSLLNDDDDDE